MDQNLNPYEPPNSSLIVDEMRDRTPLDLVKSGTRFANFFIDHLLLFAVQFCFGVSVALIFGAKGTAHLQSGCTANLYAILFALAYYTFMEYKFGFTLGKLVTKTRVVNESGGRPTFSQVLGRSFSRYIPFEPLSCFGSESRGWHDSLPKTFVVKREVA
jgi:uncharacterized RDD family membrane protein YckC